MNFIKIHFQIYGLHILLYYGMLCIQSSFKHVLITSSTQLTKSVHFLEVTASKGMHQVCTEKSPDRHLSIHPRRK